MREQNSNTNEYVESWDTGTYQTGPSKPKKGQSILITVLLMAVIFLGGIASALGIMNVHLLIKLTQQNSELNLSAEDTGNAADFDFFHSDEDMAVQLPEEQVLELRLGFRVQELDALCREYWRLSNEVQVVAVTDSNSRLQEGDILTYINGEKITGLAQIYDMAEKASVGEKVQFGVLRAGRQFVVELTVQDP